MKSCNLEEIEPSLKERKKIFDELDQYDIKQELDFVYITKDGKRFVELSKAIAHQKRIKNKLHLIK